jgi:hypothetical protein
MKLDAKKLTGVSFCIHALNLESNFVTEEQMKNFILYTNNLKFINFGNCLIIVNPKAIYFLYF